LLGLLKRSLGAEECGKEALGLSPESALEVLLESTPTALPGQLLLRMKTDLAFRREVLKVYQSALQ
jgi:hypothetical protein